MWNALVNPCLFRQKNRSARRQQDALVMLRVYPCEFGAEKKDLRRVVDPGQQDKERACGAICGCEAAPSEVQTNADLADCKPRRRCGRAEPNIFPCDVDVWQDFEDCCKQHHS